MRKLFDWLRPRVVVVREKPLTEREMNEALAGLPDSHPVWRTVNQLIDTAERNAWDSAAASADNPHLVGGYVGGSRHLDLLRQDLVIRRGMGQAKS